MGKMNGLRKVLGIKKVPSSVRVVPPRKAKTKARRPEAGPEAGPGNGPGRVRAALRMSTTVHCFRLQWPKLEFSWGGRACGALCSEANTRQQPRSNENHAMSM